MLITFSYGDVLITIVVPCGHRENKSRYCVDFMMFSNFCAGRLLKLVIQL